MSDNLYELSTQLAKINNEIFDADGELTEELEKRLDDSTLAMKDKVQSIVKWTLNLKGKAEMIDAEIERLQHKKKMTDNLNKRLSDYVRQAMLAADINKIEYPTFTVCVQKNPRSVEIIDEEIIPSAYKIVKQVISVDKRRLMDDLTAGEKIQGCQLVTTMTHLRIR